MAAPNMAAITASLERSMQNCSLNHHHHHRSSSAAGDAVRGRPTTSTSSSSSSRPIPHHDDHDDDNDDAPQNHQLPNAADTSTTTTTLELNSHVSLPYHWEQCLDLKTGEIYYINWRNGMKAKEDPRTTSDYNRGDYYSEEEEDDENSSYDSEESSSESSNRREAQKEQVLVVGGCKSCFMYFMVPKQVQECPKCCGQLLHFDRSENGSL